jgi:hypothetical protein
MIEAIIAVVSLAIGGGLAWVLASKNTSTKAIEIEAKASNGWMFDHWESNDHIISGDMNENERKKNL